MASTIDWGWYSTPTTSPMFTSTNTVTYQVFFQVADNQFSKDNFYSLLYGGKIEPKDDHEALRQIKEQS